MRAKTLSATLAVVSSLIVVGAASPSHAGGAPVNLAPNSQWEIFSGEGFGAKEDIEGSGVMAPVAFTGYTTGSSTVVFTVSGSSGELKVGDLITIAADGVDRALTRCPMRVTALTPNASFTVRTPLGLEPERSQAGVATPVNIGMHGGSTHTGDAADGWKKTTSLEVWREDNAVNLSPGATYALGINKDTGGREYVATEPNVTRFRGKTVVFGAYVYQKVRGGAGAWQAFVRSDGTGGGTAVSTIAPASGRYQWLEISYQVPANATTFAAGIFLNGAAGDTYYMTDPVLTVGSTIGVDNYIKPQETFVPVVHISPITWINATIDFPALKDDLGNYAYMFDAYAETGGMVAPTVTHAFGQLEGIDDGRVQPDTGYVRIMAFFDREKAPDKSGSFLPQYVAGVKSFIPLDLPLDGAGRAVYESGIAGDSWFNVSLELDWFLLQ